MTNVLKNTDFTVQVSSVLQRNVKEYGKKFMFDDKEDTCWSSDQGLPQQITLNFPSPVTFDAIAVQFQGGFAGKDCKIRWRGPTEEHEEPFYPEDVNRVQRFELKSPATDVSSLKVVFESSSDFFGRIIVYSLEVLRK